MEAPGGGDVSHERGTPVPRNTVEAKRRVLIFSLLPTAQRAPKKQFFTDNLLVRIHCIIVKIWWTGVAPWEFESPFTGSLIRTFLGFDGPNSFRDPL